MVYDGSVAEVCGSTIFSFHISIRRSLTAAERSGSAMSTDLPLVHKSDSNHARSFSTRRISKIKAKIKQLRFAIQQLVNIYM